MDNIQIENLLDSEMDRMDAPKFAGRYALITPEYLRERELRRRELSRAKHEAKRANRTTAPRLPFGDWLLAKAAANRPTRCIPVEQGGHLETLYWLDECESEKRAPVMPVNPTSWEEIARAMYEQGCGAKDLEYGRVAWDEYNNTGGAL